MTMLINLPERGDPILSLLVASAASTVRSA
jgi:hypothetical protein